MGIFRPRGGAVKISSTLPPGHRRPLGREFSQKLAGGIGKRRPFIHKHRIFKAPGGQKSAEDQQKSCVFGLKKYLKKIGFRSFFYLGR